ncbi:MAG: hypothetical protein IPI93_11920 [Sphingobacteriaceae bacterium]|nr:hypothetical protein [Sphingobacteriaceae bacterium]
MQDDIAETDPYFQTRLDALKDIRECTCQLFSIADSIPKARGSGVFVKVGDMHFLLSAAHVFESYDGQLYAPTTLGEKNYTPIGGQLNTNKINTSRQKDTTDLAILELHPDIISPLLSFYSFLDGKYLGLNHNLVNNLYYMYYGYPASKKQTKLKLLENKIIAKPNYFPTIPIDPSMYAQFGCDIHRNIVIEYNKRRTFDIEKNVQETAPDTYGMSGSGLWFIPPQANIPNKSPVKYLVSILTEWPTKNRKHILSTRIDIVTETLRQTYGFQFPISQIYQMNIDLEKLG